MASLEKDDAADNSRVSTTRYEPHYYEFARTRGDLDMFPRGEVLEYLNKELGRGARLLELGCGTGELLSKLRPDVLYTGVELSEFAVIEAKNRWEGRPNTEFIQATDVPFPDASFDAVVMVYVLEHLIDPKRFLSEALRVLRPEGSLVLAAPNLEFPLAYPNALRHRSRAYRVWFAALRTRDYLLRIFGIPTFRVIRENFSERTGRYEKKDDDLRYVVSSWEVIRYLAGLGAAVREVWGEAPRGFRRMISWLPALQYYGKPLAAVFQKI